MKYISNTFQLTLLALIVNINLVNSNVIRDANPPDANSNDCVQANNCGNDINCIAKCYNVPNPDQESILRTADCQRSCNAKYPDPYLDNQLLIQCYQDCITNEYYTPYAERKKQYYNPEAANNNVDNTAYTNNAAPNTEDISSNEPNNNVNNYNSNDNTNYINNNINNNNNNNNINNGNTNNNNNNNGMNNANTNTANTTNTANNGMATSNNQTNVNGDNSGMNLTDDDDGNDNQIYYLEEENGSKESQVFYSLLVSELVLLFTVLYLAL